MKINLLNIAMLSLILVGCVQAPSTFKDAYADKFLVGTAVSVDALNNDPAAMQLVKEQFNTVVAENCMKSGEIQAVEEPLYLSAMYKSSAFSPQIVNRINLNNSGQRILT